MDAWGNYTARMNTVGSTKRDSSLSRMERFYSKKLPGTLSYHTVQVDGSNKNIAIINSKESKSIKNIYSMPGESLPHGSIVDFANAKWLITSVDFNNEVYTYGTMEQCNYLLKWINDSGEIVERWCIVIDGTKYLIGEKNEDMMAIGDSRVAITIGKDSESDRLNRGRRFLIDDPDSTSVLAFQITKPNKMFNVYNGKGVYRFILNEVNLTDDDNVELRIADYYNWEPYRHLHNEHVDQDITLEKIKEDSSSVVVPNDDKGVWL